MSRRVEVACVGALVAVVLLGFGQIAVGRSLAGYDVTTYSLPNRVQVTEAFRRGHLPEWDPFRFGGSPLLANPPAAVLYPPHWLAAALPTGRVLGVSLCLHALVLATGAYAFARRCLAVPPVVAIIAGVGVALGGFAHAHIGHYEQATSMAWFPWALVAADVAASSSWSSGRSARLGIAALGGTIALTALAGHPQYLHMVVAAVVLYAVVTARRLVRLAQVAAGLALGLGLAAPQLLPTTLIASESIRSGGLPIAEAAQESLPLGQLLSTFVSGDRGLLSVEVLAWLPASVILFAAVGVVRGYRDRRVVALGALGLVGACLALGLATPLYRLAYVVVPGVSLFRVPSRWLLLPAMTLPLVAASGLHVVVAAAVQRRPSINPRAATVAFVVVVGIACGEALAANSQAYVRWLRMDPNSLLRRSTTSLALGDVSGRVLSVGSEDLGDFGGQRRAERPNTNVLDRLRSIDGYDGGLLTTRHWRAAMIALSGDRGFVATNTLRSAIGPLPLDAARFAELDTSRIVVHGAPLDPLDVLPSGSKLLGEIDDVRLYSTPTLGPVFLADGTVPQGLRLHRDVARPEVLLVDVPSSAAGNTVVVSEAFADGWRASDGVHLRRHHDLLLSFTAPERAGRVELRYRTPGLLPGAVVSLMGLLVVLALVFRA